VGGKEEGKASQCISKQQAFTVPRRWLNANVQHVLQGIKEGAFGIVEKLKRMNQCSDEMPETRYNELNDEVYDDDELVF
jgi:hypothetical protein